MLAVAGARKMTVKYVDIKTAYLYDEIHEDIYMKQPDGYADEDQPNLVCKLNKSLYGLKQSARAWNEMINELLVSNGFRRGTAYPSLYS